MKPHLSLPACETSSCSLLVSMLLFVIASLTEHPICNKCQPLLLCCPTPQCFHSCDDVARYECLQVVGEAHSDALLSMSGLNKALHALVTELRRVCEEVRSSTVRCLKAVDSASSQMQQSFISHQQACRFAAQSICLPTCCE